MVRALIHKLLQILTNPCIYWLADSYALHATGKQTSFTLSIEMISDRAEYVSNLHAATLQDTTACCSP